MPKPITSDMLHEMTPDQRKTLHRNASSLDTDAAREVLVLMEQEGLMEKPKAPAKKATDAKKPAPKPAKAKKPAGPKTRKVVFGRQG